MTLQRTNQYRLIRRLVFRFALLLTLVLIAMIALLFQEADDRVEEFRRHQAEGHAMTLAEGSLDALLTRDYETLERWVASAVPSDEYAYAFLADRDQRILVHSTPGMVGDRAPHSVAANGRRMITSTFEGRPVVEIIHPAVIRNQQLASAHVAYYQDTPSLLASQQPFRVLMIPALAVLLFALGALVIMRRVVTPINRLTDAVSSSSIESGTHIESDLLTRDDEIGDLAKAFNQLFARLQDYYAAQARQEERLKEMVDERTYDLVQSNRELEAFSYSVSHDLRAPLRALHGYAEVLAEELGPELDGEKQRCLSRIQAAAERMGVLIDDLLALSKIGRTEMIQRNVDISALAQEALDQLMEQHPERTIEITVQAGGRGWADSRLLRLVLDNAIGNAWKFTSRTSRPKIEFGFEDGEDKRIFYVRDNGAGFDMNYSDQLFRPFHRLHTDAEFEGTGIGLAIVQRVISRHGGRVWADSEPGKGTTLYFSLTLPQAAPSSVPA